MVPTLTPRPRSLPELLVGFCLLGVLLMGLVDLA